MCITAHPDDESGAFGGALLMAHAQGAETAVLCATAGQAGSYRSEGQSDHALAHERRAEFAAACRVLHVTHSEILDYPDGGLAQQDFYAMIGSLVERIRVWRPHVVLTFGGDGGVNLHRDHTIIGLAATAAFHWAGRSAYFPVSQPYASQKLYYSGTPFVASRNQQEAAVAARVPYSLTLELGEWRSRKLEAFMQHSTQRGVLERARENFEQHLNYERYLLAAARDPSQDNGLFAGVIEGG